MLPAGVTQVSNFYFEALLEFGSFVEDKFGIKCREKLLCSFLFSFLLVILFIGIFLEFLFTFFLPLLDFSAIVFALILIQRFVFKLLLDFHDFLLDLFAELWFFLFLWLRIIELIGSEMVLFAIQMESVVVELLVGKLAVFDDFSDLLWSEAEEDIFWFKIGVNDSADSVEEVETHQNLSGDFLHQIKREPLVIVPFENFKQINPQNLKHHTKMISIRSFIQEGVQQVEHMRVIPIKSSLVRFVLMKRIDPLGIVGFIGDFLENLDLVVGGFEIVGRAFHDLDSNVVLVLEVFCEPDG